MDSLSHNCSSNIEDTQGSFSGLQTELPITSQEGGASRPAKSLGFSPGFKVTMEELGDILATFCAGMWEMILGACWEFVLLLM
ncbi:hypothetical protein, partial [Pseudomonas aeruginosa]